MNFTTIGSIFDEAENEFEPQENERASRIHR